MDFPYHILKGLDFQGTLALIKPDAFQRRIEIEEIILKEGDQTRICKKINFVIRGTIDVLNGCFIINSIQLLSLQDSGWWTRSA